MWWNTLKLFRGRKPARRTPARRPACRPSLEVLEDRLVPTALDSNFTESTFVNGGSNLNFATGLAWAPDGSNRLFVARKFGEVRVIENGALLTTPFADVSPIFTDSECGLIGIAFDRDYVTNRYVYLFVTVSDSQQQIIRYTDSSSVGGSKTTIVGSLPTTGNNHDGGAVGIGFDNKLYWAIGDQGDGTGVDSDLASLASKVGRANLDGSVPNTNPFVDGAGGNNDYIWARGFRNPFTFTFQETTGQLWVNDVGTSYEQIFKVNAGNHGGWDDYENNQPTTSPYISPTIVYRTNGSDNRTIAASGAVRSSNIVTITTTASHGFRQGGRVTISGVGNTSFNGVDFTILSAPSATTFTYAQTGSDASSGGGTANFGQISSANMGGAVTGGAFLNNSAVSAAYQGDFFFGDYNSGRVFRVELDGSNNVSAIHAFSSGITNIVDIAVGPDGALYYVGAGDDGVVRRTAFNQSSQGLIVTPTYLAFPEGGRVGFSVRLATAPSSNVSVSVAQTSGDSDLTVHSGASLTFTSSNFATPQIVTLAAAGDADTTNDTATFSISSSGLTTQTLTYTAIDSGAQAIVISTTSLNVNEGSTGTFTVRLQDQPTGNVTVTVARTSGDSDVTVQSGATLTFTPQNYATVQTVTIAAAEDADNVNDTATISISAPAATTRTVAVTVMDNENQAPTITSTPVTTAVVNAPYTYDVNATGNPTPTYSLQTSPSGMTINATTGVISWTPTATGTFSVTVQAANGVSPNATQAYSITVNADMAPTAVLTQPTNGATVSGANAEFFGDGVDDVGTVRAEFYIDGVLRYTDVNTLGHYHFGGEHLRWDTTTLSEGSHTLRFVVYDTAGQSGFQQVTVTVQNLPFTDTFTQADNSQLSSRWTVRAGGFSIQSNAARGSGSANLATVNGPSLANAFVQARATLTTAGQYASLVARYAGPGDNNMYVASLQNNGGNFQAFLFRQLNGAWTQLASGNVTSSGTSTLRFEVVGASLKLFIDGNLALFAYDTLLTTGTVGMRVGPGVSIDDFTADAITLTTPPLPFTDPFTQANNSQLSRNWIERTGNFGIQSNAARGNAGVNLATVNGLNLANATVEGRASVITPGQYAGLVARYSGPGDNNMYVASLQNNGSSLQAFIFRQLNGAWTPLASANVISAGISTLRFEVAGASLKLFVDGNLALFAYDTLLTTGAVGMRTGPGASIDDFVTDAITLTTPALPFTDPFTQANGTTLSRNWLDRTGNFSVQSNAARGNADVNLAAVNGLNLANATVEGRATVVVSGQYAGLVARYGGPGDNNMYVASLQNNGGVFQALIFRQFNGAWTLLANANVASTGASTLRFDVAGASLKFFVDGNLAAFAFDTLLTTGTVGMRVGPGASIDDFTTDAITLTTPALPFTDPFTQANGAQLSRNWVERAGNFNIQSNVARGNSGVNLATVNGLNLANATVEARATVVIAGQYASLVARYGGPGDNNMYLASLQYDGSVFQTLIFRQLNGAWTLLASGSVTTSGASTLRFEVAGPSLKFFVDGNLALFAFDTLLTTGTVGMRVGAGASIDDFTADAITLTTPALPFTDNFTQVNGTQLSRNWLDRAGNFSIQSNAARGNASVNLSTVNGLALGNSVVEALATLASAGQFAGLVSRYSGPGDANMYLATLQNTGSGFQALIFRQLNGQWTLLASGNVATAANFALRFETTGTTLRLTVNSTVVATASDSQLTTGTVGIRTGLGVTMDDFKVS